MDAKEAVEVAIQYVAELYREESVSNLGLEEVIFDVSEDVWNVTVGFSRPWDNPQPGLAAAFQKGAPTRAYKVVEIDAANGKVRSITIRDQE